MNALLVAYDIADDARRSRVAKELIKLGRHVQYSVFLVRDHAPARVVGLVKPHLSLTDDDVRIHPVCVMCEAKAVLLGRAGSGPSLAGFRVI